MGWAANRKRKSLELCWEIMTALPTMDTASHRWTDIPRKKWGHQVLSTGETEEDPSMGGLGGCPPLSKSRGWSWLWEAVCLKHGGELSLNSLTFGPSSLWKWTKVFSCRGLDLLIPHQVLSPWTPLEAPTQTPIIGSRCAFTMVWPHFELKCQQKPCAAGWREVVILLGATSWKSNQWKYKGMKYKTADTCEGSPLSVPSVTHCWWLFHVQEPCQ